MHSRAVTQHHTQPTIDVLAAAAQSNCMPEDDAGHRTAGAPVHMLIGHSGAPFSWAVNPRAPPFYEAVQLRHGYLRVHANRTALTMQARTVIHHACALTRSSLHSHFRLKLTLQGNK